MQETNLFCRFCAALDNQIENRVGMFVWKCCVNWSVNSCVHFQMKRQNFCALIYCRNSHDRLIFTSIIPTMQKSATFKRFSISIFPETVFPEKSTFVFIFFLKVNWIRARKPNFRKFSLKISFKNDETLTVWKSLFDNTFYVPTEGFRQFCSRCYRPHTEGMGKILFLQVSVCRYFGGGGVLPSGWWGGGYSHLPLRGGTPSFLVGGSPILPDGGVPPTQVRIEWYPLPHPGQVPGQDGAYHPTRTAQHVLAARRTVCLLHSRRRTFLLQTMINKYLNDGIFEMSTNVRIQMNE